jgi:hypothetical protein
MLLPRTSESKVAPYDPERNEHSAARYQDSLFFWWSYLDVNPGKGSLEPAIHSKAVTQGFGHLKQSNDQTTAGTAIAMIARAEVCHWDVSRVGFILVFILRPPLPASGDERIAIVRGPLKTESGQRCAHPRRISVTPNPTHTIAVTRNVGTYSDPSHAM